MRDRRELFPYAIDLFQFPVEHVRMRHQLLERLVSRMSIRFSPPFCLEGLTFPISSTRRSRSRSKKDGSFGEGSKATDGRASDMWYDAEHTVLQYQVDRRVFC